MPTTTVPTTAVPTPTLLTEVGLPRLRVTGGLLRRAADLNRGYLLELDPDRLLARFREYAGLPAKAEPYGGWESAGVSGHTLGHYLSACSMMVAAGDHEFDGRVRYLVDQLRDCQLAHGDGYVAAIPRGRELFAELQRGEIRSQGFDLNGGWVPFYTLHKLFAGLRDAYRWAGSALALQIAIDLGDWLQLIMAGLDHDQLQQILACEFGGMGEVLADLSVDAGRPDFLELSERFHHDAIMEPLARHRDELSGKHANTQVPKVIAAARQYELTGRNDYREIADYFWHEVVGAHSYLIGGNSLHEHFGDPGQLSDRLGSATCETCNTYNMIKLTRLLFARDPRAEYADYHERALYNHILGSQHSGDGSVCYYVSLEMGGHKDFRSKFDQFSCCIGSGMENHAAYPAGAYFTCPGEIFVSQYLPSEMIDDDLGVRIQQVTDFPEQETVMLRIGCSDRTRFTLQLRHPYWAVEPVSVGINDETPIESDRPTGFIALDREWSDGDVVRLRLPMSLRIEAMPDNPNRIAFCYGPMVLAGDLGEPASTRSGDPVPVLVADRDAVIRRVVPDERQPLTFRMRGLGRPRDVTLRPFYAIDDERYSVYWDLFTDEEWLAAETDYRAELAKLQRLAERTVDVLQPGEMQPERDHDFAGEASRVGEVAGRKFRESWLDGWFSYQLRLAGDGPTDLIITFGTNAEPVNRYDVTVDDEPLGPGEQVSAELGRFVHYRYRLTAGGDSGTVRFAAHPGAKVAKVFGLRTARGEESG